MTLLSVPNPNIPLLVQEKVDFYYYRDQWRRNIIQMHQEYRKRVKRCNIDYGNTNFEQELCWVTKTTMENIYFCICSIESVRSKRKIKQKIRQFNRYSSFVGEMPQKYYYSSGLYSKDGYKKTPRQIARESIFTES